MREHAAAYLREIADRFPEVSSRALSDAAAFYNEEIGAILTLINICKGHENFTTPMRQKAVEAINAALAAEKKAIEKIEAALASLPSEAK